MFFHSCAKSLNVLKDVSLEELFKFRVESLHFSIVKSFCTFARTKMANFFCHFFQCKKNNLFKAKIQTNYFYNCPQDREAKNQTKNILLKGFTSKIRR
jgi:hypothetical protein